MKVWTLIIMFFISAAPKVFGAAAIDADDRYIMTLSKLRWVKDGRDPMPVRGVIEYRNNFRERIKQWEFEKGREMGCRDLIDPYLEKDEEGKLFIKKISKFTELEDVNGLYKDEFWKYFIKFANKWSKIAFYFNPSYFGDNCNKYDRLFSLQISLELYRLGYRPFSAGGYYILGLDKKYSEEERKKRNRLSCKVHSDSHLYAPTMGMVEDFPVQGVLGKIGCFLTRTPPPLPPSASDLPTTDPGSVWKYLHEVPNIGFSVFAHAFPELRSEILGYEAYGIKGLPQRPFIPSPYVVTPEGVAAAASSVGATGPAAAAAASSADIESAAAAEDVDSETVGLLRKRI